MDIDRYATQTIGYPRIGKNRQLKKALEAYWQGDLDEVNLLDVYQQVEEESWRDQLQAGIDLVGVGEATLYDHVLDWAVRFGLVPERFRPLQGLDRYFTMARGAPGIPALELTKWFDTNYHYLVPEIEPGLVPQASFTGFLKTVERAQLLLGDRAAPIVLGPVSLLLLSRLEAPLAEALAGLLPLYRTLLEGIKSLEVREVQLHEPTLVLAEQEGRQVHYQQAYSDLAQAGLPINLVTCFDDLGENYPWVVELPVEALSLDFTRGDNLALIRQHGWPHDKVLAAGVLDGRNVWRARLEQLLPLLEELRRLASIRVGPSSSLQFVPYQAAREVHLPEALRDVLAFAVEKLAEVRLLARSASGEDLTAEVKQSQEAWERFAEFAPTDPVLQERLQNLGEGDFRRSLPYAGRRSQQVQLPLLPTTTIGSFPQTGAIRRLRGLYKRGEIALQEYLEGIDAWIAYTVGVQDGLGLDVIVHGEFERSDMVEYFAEKLKGFAFTENGWVQSYGNRYVRPPIIYADVLRPEPLTLREFKVAQAFTAKPVKGMLTGPVTILNWSYPRQDIPAREIVYQLALVLREEIADLEEVGVRVIQVDEPALREGLPLKSERQPEYLTWAIDAFRLATGGARPETQIHTHMCYSEFGAIMDAIDRMDADVISIENARSGDETLRELAQFGYQRQVGPGVYDVHSSVVPPVEAVNARLRAFLEHLPAGQIWVNPDCGLKTRRWEEVIPSLKNILQAVEVIRNENGMAV